ncbi:MAG: DEAD/DEAH box helicase, partial [Deltaproteobacteria bacterium]|nr:DEAD/DEAH box helicase [Deltaproteobacteria bacterium]
MESIPFHPIVRAWFRHTFAAPTAVQTAGWEKIAAGDDTLIAAPTGSGKTLAAFLWAVNRLVVAAESGDLEDRIQVVYVSPLKALSNDIEKNLRGPLKEIRDLAEAAGTPLPEIRIAVRTGDTPGRERQLMVRKPPHILVTTPESLYILLTAGRSRAALEKSVTVIVDEIHAVAGDKRGAHLALSLERLDRLAGRGLQRIGLSATQKPLDEVARLLGGAARCDSDGRPRCAIIDAGHRRELDIRIETGEREISAIATHEQRDEIYDRIAELVGQHRTTIVFVNTRRLVERVAHALSDRLGKDKVAAHHGSLSKETRLAAEQGLKAGDMPVVVATASLELGIDVGHVDLVVHLGAPRALATLLQRVGRSGHWLGAVPKGIVLPLTRDDLVQAAAAVRAIYAGDLDRLTIPENPLDILAQQIVATAASEDIPVEELWDMVRRAHSYRALPREDFDAVIEMLSEGISSRRGRRSAHLHFDRVNGVVRARRGARLAAITGGGAIPDTADYDVIAEPAGTFVGRVNEDFAVESLAGDIILLGNRSWRILRVEAGRMRVADADGLPPTIPFWLGEAPSRTEELSVAVADLRREVAARRDDPGAAADWLVAETRVDRSGAEQITTYISDAMAVLGAMPTLDTLVAERFFDESGGMQLVLHAPFGGRINRALGLALRKRFCLSFDFELQAAATDDGIVLSLGEQHSFPLESVFSMVRSHLFEEDLVQAALASPMFTNRWRWNVTRSLAVLRHSGGKRVPMPIQRMRAEDLMASVFPAQIACGDNHAGPIEAPDHPLVNETIDNCLHEAMDAEGLRRVLQRIEAGEIRTVAIETPAPSPLSHEILNANPYAFLDDAPLEERRARAVSLRRTDPDLASGIGALDESAIAEVRRVAWPDARDADE